MIPKATSKRGLQKLEKKCKEIQKASIKNMEKYNSILSWVIHEFKKNNFDFCWGHGRFIADPPEKVEMQKNKKEKYNGEIIVALNELWHKTKKSAYVSAAYFVPGDTGI